MKFTGERYLPELTDFNISYEHWHRYLYANNFVKNKVVLDIACGEGYGTYILSKQAQKVVGVDINSEVINYANENYKAANLEFTTGSASDIPINDKQLFDVIISFETIEHISEEDQIKFLSEIKRLLKPDGIFIVSTPNKLLYSDIPSYHNEYHLKEFYRAEFENFLNKSFKYTSIIGQQICTASYISDTDKTPNDILEFNLKLTNEGFLPSNEQKHDIYMIAICSDIKFKRPQTSITFDPNFDFSKHEPLNQTLYFDTGEGLSERNKIVKEFQIQNNNKFVLDFDLSKINNLKHIRLDPCDDFCRIKIKSAILVLEDNSTSKLEFSTNALKTASDYLDFRTKDPQINFLSNNLERAQKLLIEIEYLSIGEESKITSLQNKSIEIERTNGKIRGLENKLIEIKKDLAKYKSKLSDQKVQLTRKDGVITEYKEKVIQKQNLVIDFEKQIDEKNKLLVQNELHFEKHKKTLEDKEKTIALQKEEIHERDISISKYERYSQQKDALIQEKIEIINRNEKELINTQLNLLALKDELIIQKQDMKNLSNLIHEKADRNAELEKEIQNRQNYIDDLLNSLSFRLGWFLTSPARYIYNLFKDGTSAKFKNWFWLKVLIIAIKNPKNTIKQFNINNIKTLIWALKHEDKSTIINNYQKLIVNPTSEEENWTKINVENNIINNSSATYHNLDHEIYLLNKSELFDEKYYLANTPGIENVKISALEHYLLSGWKEGRNPSAKFNTNYYLSAYPDVANTFINPLVHYIEHGKAENRAISSDNFTALERNILISGQIRNISIKPSTILFISHDARLAGAEILLLHLLKWFFENTVYQLKIICLEGGLLLEKFQTLGSTIVWQDYITQFPKKADRQKALNKFCDKVDLIYGNTVISPLIYDELSFLGVPFITHVHELEKSIKKYTAESTLKKMHRYTDAYIACSTPVSENLIKNHDADSKQLNTIFEFIDKYNYDNSISKSIIRKNLDLLEDVFIVFGCGTIYWRKGVDHFIETAIELKKSGYTKFHFYWIGEHHWDSGHKSGEFASWNDLEQRIVDEGIENHITFLGVKDNPRDYFLAGDVFYLSAREDPFPLVCLEAAECRLPIICFTEAGGMPDFVENDAGFVVPYEDVKAAANKIGFLMDNHNILDKLGLRAKEKVLEHHTVDIAAPQILEFCQQVVTLKPLVSIIIPNYNYQKYLKKRILSILNQTFKDFEIIILDDASTDQSLEIIEEYSNHSKVRIIKSQSNSGNPFLQWHKGFMEARGEIVWFAEADDFCESNFLHKLLPLFNNDAVALVYSDSYIVDSDDNIIGDYTLYYEKVDTNHWKSSYQISAVKEINFGLGIKNTIPNVSAVLFRKSFITEEIFNKTFQFKFSGDWFFYTQVINGKTIAYHSEKLNFHRKTTQTITSKFNSENLEIIFKEAKFIHDDIIEKYCIYDDFLKKWEFYITEQIHAFYPNTIKEEFNKYYPYFIVEKNIKEAIIRSKNSKRLVFITTNDGSPNGGSEQLWRQSAFECSKRGHEVMVVIKKWNPEPFFIKDFYIVGITVIYKELDHFSQVLKFNPDLIVISIGDQDEGIDYYESCKINNIPYIIVNHLTKEPKYWPIRTDIAEQVKKGYFGAKIVLFTGRNNREVMEKRLSCKIPNAGIFYNPFDINRNIDVPFPSMEEGLKIAIVGNLLRIHKGQHLAIELFKDKKWRNRPIHLNIYGKGNDEEILKKLVRNYNLTNVTFHGHTNDILAVWKENHAILLPSFMEGLPLVLIGAMLCGRVPILTDIGAHREVVADNINGFIATNPTVEALDEALERAYQNSATWEEIGQKAREKILSIIPEDPIDDFISKIITSTDKAQDIQSYENGLKRYSDIETKIHSKDEMYLFFTTHPAHKDTPLRSYFDSGAGMLQSLLDILDKIEFKIEEINSFLEFACGYGRFTRHLVKIIPPQKVTGSDVYKEAVDFQKNVFGVKGFYSEFNPEDITIHEKYDIIFVTSLFSHLPLKTWRPWLKKLYQSLNENGVLIFSTHGKSCMANPDDMPESGFLYCQMSESKIHSCKDYATTYVTSEFVNKAVFEETGQLVLLEVPKCLWRYQDVTVVRRAKFLR